VALRPAREEDVQALTKILAEPEVARWWGDNDPDSVRAELGNAFVVLVDDAVAGWITYWEETDPDYRHVGLDISMATEFQGRGFGPEALRLAIRHFIDQGHHRFTIDPAAHNGRAIRAYAKVGFKPVGVMRDYERAPDGMWHDGLLMDLLASELPD
jgi:aminoglycoside 6'-N-acetyltransferase